MTPNIYRPKRASVPTEKLKAHKNAQAKRLETRPGYRVNYLHTDMAKTRMPSVEQLVYLTKHHYETFKEIPTTLYVPMAIVKYTGFFVELEGVRTYIPLDVKQGETGDAYVE